eukprot:gene19363-23153_t
MAKGGGKGGVMMMRDEMGAHMIPVRDSDGNLVLAQVVEDRVKGGIPIGAHGKGGGKGLDRWSMKGKGMGKGGGSMPDGPWGPGPPGRLAGGRGEGSRGSGKGGEDGTYGDEGGLLGRPGTKQVCLDYEERGFCMRGALCPYDHGDRIIVEDLQ